jgi:hypothetical protein
MKQTRVYAGLRAVREFRKRAEGDSYETVPDGKELLVFDVLVSRDDLNYMAARAARNKNGKCKAGPVTVIITHRERTS